MVKLRIFLLIFLPLSSLAAQNSAEDLLSEVNAAVADERYTRAIALLEEGKTAFPADPEIPRRAGQLYMERELYRLALAEFQAAGRLKPPSPELLRETASALGYLGRNGEAAEVLEGLLERGKTENRVIEDLSWLYFKTYRMHDGINLLEEALKQEFRRSWAHTLGTLYSGLYNAEESRKWYQRSIDDALLNGDVYFASVARYNLSLLEYTMYRYDAARKQALLSQEHYARAGSHLVIGELDFMNWRLSEALESYRAAESLDVTPLARVDMAVLYQRTGYPDEAIRIVTEVKSNPDTSWMYHYGVDENRFSMDLNEILADAWTGKAREAALRPGSCSWFRRKIWRIKGLYYDRLNRSQTLELAKELQNEQNELDAAWHFSQAASGYSALALFYLDEARRIETALTERAAPWYDLETGLETGSSKLLSEALAGFTHQENDGRERALRGLGAPAEVLETLWQMNPGGLRQYGLSLPVGLETSGPRSRALYRRTRSLLRRAGYSVSRRRDASVLLSVSRDDDGQLRCYLTDPNGQTRPAEAAGRRDLAAVLDSLLDRLYTTRL